MIVYQSTKQVFARGDAFSNEIDKKILEAYEENPSGPEYFCQ